MLKEGAAARLKSLRLFLCCYFLVLYASPLLRDLAIVSFPQNTFIRK